MTIQQITSDHIIFYFLSLNSIIKKSKQHLNSAMLEAFVEPFEQSSVTLVKYTHMHIHIHRENIIISISTVIVTFPQTFQLVWSSLKVDWVFNSVICQVFDGVVQITEERAKEKEFFEDQKCLFILLSDPICCHSNRFLLNSAIR